MKKLMLIALALALLASLSACAKTEPPAETTLTAKIIKVYDGSLLVAEESGGLYTVGTADAEITTSVLLGPGMSVEIGYGGDVAESYPMQINDAARISSVADGGDLVGLYLQIAEDLWRDAGEGLTFDIDTVAFNLSEAQNLSRGEKNALLYLAEGAFGYEAVEGTLDELREQGYIEDMWFPHGVLFNFYNMTFEKDSFDFAAQIGRSAEGAIIYGDCKAALMNGEWSYEPGGWAIS